MVPRGCFLLLCRVHPQHGLRRRLSSHAAGASGERWRGHLQQQPEERRGHLQQQPEESKAVKVSVWWDFQRCQLPPGANPCRVAPRVTAALRAAGIRGPVEITAFGDVYVLPRAAQEALTATGVAFSHVPPSGKDGSDRSFMADLVYWIAQNPPPAHFFLISGDDDFANILHRLRMSNYNILLACPNADSGVLCSAATIMWPWEALVEGVDLSPKYFNQPPDGSACSWYGHYRGALDDPFMNTESENSMALPSHTKPVKPHIVPKSVVNGVRQALDYHPEGVSLPSHTKPVKLPIVPKSVVNGVRQALDFYPEGVSLPDLQAELKRNSVFLDKGLFGFGKFSALLQAMPDVVKFIDPLPGDCQPAVVGAYKRSVEPIEQSFKRMNSAQSNGEVKRLNEAKNEKPPSSDVPSSPSDLLSTDQQKITAVDAPSSPSDSLSTDQRKAPLIDLITQSEPPASHMEADFVTAAGTPSLGAQGTISKKGLFERICILWNGPEPIKPEVYPSHDATCSKGSNDLPTQEGHNTDQHNRLLKRILKIFPRTDNPDGKDLDSTSAVSTSLSNIPSSDRSDKLNVKENFANTENHSNKTTDMSKAEQIDGFGENSKGVFSWAARWWSSGKSDTEDNRNSTAIVDGTRKESDKESAFVKTAASASGQRVGIELFQKCYFWDALEQYLLTPHGSDLVSKAKTREELVHGLQKQGCWPLKGLDETYLHQLVELLVSEKNWIEESSAETFPFLLTLPQKRACVPSHSNKSIGLSSLFTNGRPSEQCKSLHDRSTTTSTKSFQILPSKNGNGPASCKGDEKQSNGDDFVWEDLGPVSGTGNPHQEIDKGKRYHPPTLSDDENRAASQQAGRDAAQSSLHKIIASWNTSKDGGSSKKDNGIDGLVDCSRTNGGYREDLIPRNAQKPTRVPKYCFVSDSDEVEEKDKLVNSVLGALQKAKSSRLPG